MLRSIVQWIVRLFRRPQAYAVSYVADSDGRRTVTLWTVPAMAQDWARWCRSDGCIDVRIDRLYDAHEVRAAYAAEDKEAPLIETGEAPGADQQAGVLCSETRQADPVEAIVPQV